MPPRDAFVWSSRLQTGVGLYALALICLVIVAPNGVGICSAIGGAATLALFGVTGARALMVALTVIMLAVFTCGLFAAMTLHSFVLLPVAVVQIAAVALMDERERRGWLYAAAN
jgi:preprotein translocase subunit SecG